MREKQIELLVEKMRKTLSSGGRIIVIGWMDRNHSDDTRRWESTKKVLFLEASNIRGGDSKCLAILTPFVREAHRRAVTAAGIHQYPHPMPTGVIKQVLSLCADLFTQSVSQEEVLVPPPHQSERTQEETLSLNDLAQSLLATEVFLDNFDKLAQGFTELAQTHTDQLVGSRSLSVLLGGLGIEERAPDLVAQGWLVSVTLEGKKKIGWYRAGDKLAECMSKGLREEPKDPIDKARYLITQRPHFEEKIKELQEQITHWQEQIKRVELAEQLLKQLSDI